MPPRADRCAARGTVPAVGAPRRRVARERTLRTASSTCSAGAASFIKRATSRPSLSESRSPSIRLLLLKSRASDTPIWPSPDEPREDASGLAASASLLDSPVELGGLQVGGQRDRVGRRQPQRARQLHRRQRAHGGHGEQRRPGRLAGIITAVASIGRGSGPDPGPAGGGHSRGRSCRGPARRGARGGWAGWPNASGPAASPGRGRRAGPRCD